jgi:SPP1 family predicted phage head-tail adaptor
VTTMFYREVIELKSASYEENDLGDTVQVLSEPRYVFANKKSVRQSEFYQASAAGFKPELMFEIRSFEYEGENVLTFEGKDLSIIRTHSKNGEITELICTGLVNEVT